MKLKRALKYIREGDFASPWAWFAAKTFWPLLHRDLGTGKAVRVMEQDWDYLIVLDACRYDTFKEVVDAQAGCVISGGTHTQAWLEWNFRQEYRDVIYVAGNPHFATAYLKKTLGFNPFYMVEEVWDYGWDDSLKTVPPEQVTNAALKTLKTYPEKRMIVHYMQPHHPYIADRQLLDADDGTYRGFEDTGRWPEQITPLRLARRGKVSIHRVKKAYEQNLRIVMKEVERLKEWLPGRVILTADHGDLFGEQGLYGHGTNLRVDALVKVPWVILKDEKRRRASGEPGGERTRVRAKIVDLKRSGRL
jgi:hypothetical protein